MIRAAAWAEYRNRPTLLGCHQVIVRLRELLATSSSTTALKKAFRLRLPLEVVDLTKASAQNERAIAAEIDKMRMEEAIASKDPAVAQQYFSEVYGKGTLDQKIDDQGSGIGLRHA